MTPCLQPIQMDIVNLFTTLEPLWLYENPSKYLACHTAHASSYNAWLEESTQPYQDGLSAAGYESRPSALETYLVFIQLSTSPQTATATHQSRSSPIVPPARNGNINNCINRPLRGFKHAGCDITLPRSSWGTKPSSTRLPLTLEEEDEY
jgi:hypothetical protein